MANPKTKWKWLMTVCLVLASTTVWGQTTIEVMSDQPEKLEAAFIGDPPIPVDQTVLFGENIEISGGETPYGYQWTKNGENVGTGTTLEVHPYYKSDIYSLMVTDANNCTYLLVMPWNTDVPSLGEGAAISSLYSVYPVPATRRLTIDPGENQNILRVEFYNGKGDIIMEKRITGITVVDIDLPNGIYMVKITDTLTGTAETKKIVVL